MSVSSLFIGAHDILRMVCVCVSFLFLHCRCKSQNLLWYQVGFSLLRTMGWVSISS